jgi:hypothetical protein
MGVEGKGAFKEGYLVSVYKVGQSCLCHAEFISASRGFNGL